MSRLDETLPGRRSPAISKFEWRAPLGTWRWLILGSLGVAPSACGGRTVNTDTDVNAGSLQGTGGTASTTPVTNLPPVANPATPDFEPGVPPMPATPTTTASECVLEDTLEGGWERCTNGMLHRPREGTCSSTLPRADHDVYGVYGYDNAPDAGLLGECRRDSDCTADVHGHCELGQGGPYCAYGCLTDADCDPGQACLCGPPVGECRPAECRTDADCPSGSLCGSYERQPHCGGIAFACQTPEDTCAGDKDCGGTWCTRETIYSSDYSDQQEARHRSCSTSECIIGRPFLVHGCERLAPGMARADWYPQAPAAPAFAGPVADDLRIAIARGWTEQALMEHASVAAFARFSLQLLSLGAPPDLLLDAASAMQDEIRHARACFELARRHLDHDIGPGPLAVEDALADMDLCSIVVNTVREGCIGETVAALEAAEALQHCEDPAARAVLEQIAVEEGRHAELAWRFVAWALKTASPELVERVREAFEIELRAARGGHQSAIAVSAFDHELARHGLLSSSVRAALRDRVLSAVVAPSAQALLAAAGTGARTDGAAVPVAAERRA